MIKSFPDEIFVKVGVELRRLHNFVIALNLLHQEPLINFLDHAPEQISVSLTLLLLSFRTFDRITLRFFLLILLRFGFSIRQLPAFNQFLHFFLSLLNFDLDLLQQIVLFLDNILQVLTVMDASA